MCELCGTCMYIYSLALSTFRSVEMPACACVWCLFKGYKCLLSQRPEPIAVRWKRFSLACRLNIGFSKKSIKGLIIKMNKYSLPSKLFQDLQFPIATVALLLFTVLCWHTQSYCMLYLIWNWKEVHEGKVANNTETALLKWITFPLLSLFLCTPQK